MSSGENGSPLQRLRKRQGVSGQGARFVLSGGVVMAVYLLTTTTLATVVGLPFQVALAIGFGLALTVHFTLHRLFVWGHRAEFALPIRGQARRYMFAMGAQYIAMAAITSLLPSVLGLSNEVVYLAAIPLLTALNFLVFSRLIFHRRATVPGSLDPRSPGGGPSG